MAAIERTERIRDTKSNNNGKIGFTTTTITEVEVMIADVATARQILGSMKAKAVIRVVTEDTRRKWHVTSS